MKNLTSSPRGVDTRGFKIKEIERFWRLSTSAMSICKQPMDDKAYAALAELRDELDTIVVMTDQPDLQKKAATSIELLDKAVDQERKRQQREKNSQEGAVA